VPASQRPPLHPPSRRLLGRSLLCAILVLAFGGGGVAAASASTARRQPALAKPPHTVATRQAPGVAKPLSLRLVRPQPGPAATTPTTWRLCPGIEDSALVLVAPAALSSVASVTWTSSPPMVGCRVTGELVRGPAANSFLLVHLKAPASARPGRYPGVLTVRLSAAGGGSPGAAVGRLSLAAEVLPFELMRPSKQYAVSRVPVRAGETRSPEQADAAALRQLREIGIGALYLDVPPQDRASLEETMRAAGLRGPILAPVSDAPPPHPLTSLPPRPLTSQAYSIRWYATVDGTPSAADAVAALKAGGAMVACRMDERAAPEAPVGAVDLPIFDASGAHFTPLVGRSGPLGATRIGWWRWDAGSATVLDNRLRSGPFLWKSGLSGALVEIDPEAAAREAWPLRWDGVRQGILDSRYLTTLFALMRQVKDKDRSNRLPEQAETAVAAALKGLARQPSPTGADRFRELVVSWTLRLHRVVGS
jgi:hypothetical protein